MKEEPFLVKVSDLGAAATLVACEFEVIRTFRDPSGRIYFVFNASVALDETMNGYFTGVLKVSARKLFDSIKMLKDRIYAER